MKSTRRTGGSRAVYARVVNYIRSEAANLSKILNGPKGNEASKTAASVEMLNGIEKPPASLRIISI